MAAQEAPPLVEIDGAFGEGGGQILRNSTAYAVLYKRPVRVVNIRANRPGGGGLRPQHCSAMTTVGELGNASLQGVEPKSKTVEIIPGDLKTAGSVVADPGTAGSTMLLAQAVLPVMVAAAYENTKSEHTHAVTPSADSVQAHTPVAAARAAEAPPLHVTLRGGTSQTMAPLVEYLMEVLIPTLKRTTGVHVRCSLVKRGYVPKGQGEVTLQVTQMPAEVGPPTALGAPHLPIWAFNLTQRGTRMPRLVAHVSCSGYGAKAVETLTAAALDATRAAVPAMQEQFLAGVFASEAATDPGNTEVAVQVHSSEAGEHRTLGRGVSLVLVAHDDRGNMWGSSGIHSDSGKGSKGGRGGRGGGGKGGRGGGKKRVAAAPEQAAQDEPAVLQQHLQRVFESAQKQLARELRTGGCVDSFAADQLVVFAAMTRHPDECRVLLGTAGAEEAGGSVSEHLRAAVYVADTLSPHRCVFLEEQEHKSAPTGKLAFLVSRPAE